MSDLSAYAYLVSPPARGVRQKLRDWLHLTGVVEDFRIDRNRIRKVLYVTSRVELTLPLVFDEHKVVWRQAETFELNLEERLIESGLLQRSRLKYWKRK